MDAIEIREAIFRAPYRRFVITAGMAGCFILGLFASCWLR